MSGGRRCPAFAGRGRGNMKWFKWTVTGSRAPSVRPARTARAGAGAAGPMGPGGGRIAGPVAGGDGGRLSPRRDPRHLRGGGGRA